jgi:hypothetical protein
MVLNPRNHTSKVTDVAMRYYYQHIVKRINFIVTGDVAAVVRKMFFINNSG